MTLVLCIWTHPLSALRGQGTCQAWQTGGNLFSSGLLIPLPVGAGRVTGGGDRTRSEVMTMMGGRSKGEKNWKAIVKRMRGIQKEEGREGKQQMIIYFIIIVYYDF